MESEYFDWMCDMVCKNANQKQRYTKLLAYLHSTDFTFSIPFDANRFEDGVDLRYRFGEEKRIRDSAITRYLDNRPCSVLEMMVALALRCEEHIMSDDEFGDRKPKWFWSMINNLGLRSMTDRHYDTSYVERCIGRFLNREYERNGKGGLFIIKNAPRDVRSVDIWCQLCWYLDEELRGE